MCGICGFTGDSDKNLLEAMTARLEHRGPDSSGFYVGDGMSLGMRRLSIIDLATGGQPVPSEDKSVWVVFNGEIYNHPKLRGELAAKGHVFRTNSDTEVLVHLYEEYGSQAPSLLEGMFAFAIWDEKKHALFIARDQLGIKPLYYSLDGGGLSFASELKALLARPGLSREINPAAVDSYMTFLNVPAPDTIFKSVKKLPPAHWLSFSDGSLEIKRYWDVPQAPEPVSMPDGELERQFGSLFDDVVRGHMLSDVPLGVFLSGGLDSGAIAAAMARAGGGEIRTFSAGFEDSRDSSYNELGAAAETARHLGSLHTELLVRPDFASLLPKMAWHLDEPFADSGAALNMLISEQAARHVKVALAGIGGDEFFMGYPRYLGMRLLRYYGALPRALKFALASGLEFLPESDASGSASGRLKRFARGALSEPLDCYLSWVSFLDQRLRSELYSPQFEASLLGSDTFARHRAAFGGLDEKFGDYRYPLLDMKTYLCDDLLAMADKMSMSASLEVRVPFCSPRLLEFAAGLGPDRHLAGLKLKSFLKKAVSGRLPPALFKRRKQGFMLPLSRWLKEELREPLRELLSESSVRRRGYFNPSAVAGLVAEHESGRANNADRLWALMMLEQWHRTYADGGGRA